MSEGVVQVARWGNSLAVRLPADLVRRLGLREGDTVELRADEGGLVVQRAARPEEVLRSLRQFRGSLPADQRLSRDDANAR
ncbi:AbrB/MazE/SpoVT family DNA-binding domain-containing protein [Salinarimonas ramus]|uniref:AbrB/MazE/SpoVT family DNA-binding domain-containing protein n=1 Tax=Salinarimonas ramus TaxID=690164 RepID=UPI0027E458FB|nr:AbrB/MazE/SpoVT family DNA-binding domain-containing protein [Salinarimonas ramus]